MAPIGTSNTVHVRPYESRDLKSVHRLYMQVSLGPNSPPSAALNAQLVYPTSCMAYVLFNIGLGASVSSRTSYWRFMGGAMFFFAAFFAGRRWVLSGSFAGYCEESLNTHLAEISAHYGVEAGNPSGPSGFWVAEAGGPDGGDRIIVGCMGLGMILSSYPTLLEI